MVTGVQTCALPISTPDRTDTWKLDLLGNWVGDSTYAGRSTSLFENGVLTHNESRTDSINERNELTFLQAATNGTTAPAILTIYDQSGNLVYDGVYFYQYDAWGRLIQINQTTPVSPAPAVIPPPIATIFNFSPALIRFPILGVAILLAKKASTFKDGVADVCPLIK